MKPVRLPAAATKALPRWALFALCLLYILPGLVGRDPWKTDDAAGFGIMWTMAHGSLFDWLSPHIVGLPVPQEAPLAFWFGAICIKLFGWLLGEAMAARVAPISFFLLGSLAVWYTTYLLGRRNEAQPLKLAFGGQPEPKDFGRTLADGALLIYLGCLGLLTHSHTTTSDALQVSLVASAMYMSVRVFEERLWRNAIGLGAVLGLLCLTGSWLIPAAVWLGIVILAAIHTRRILPQLAMIVLPLALLLPGAWIVADNYLRPFGNVQTDAWLAWNYTQIGMPTWDTLRYFLTNSIWFAWPAWPFAIWAVYAWRRQREALHITLPLTFFSALLIFALLNPRTDEASLLLLLPMLAILAAFGLPTMKRGAINAVDWFSVMTLTTCAAFIWVGWIAKQTGWPAQIAKNAFKIAPGFKPEFSWIATLVAFAVSAGWIGLVYWRVSRRPSVLWRAVVLSSGGIILCWLLLMTLWLPWGNYIKSYASVARQIHAVLPATKHCVETDIGSPQRASLAYFGDIRFAQFDQQDCTYLLLQDHHRSNSTKSLMRRGDQSWRLIWQGRRPSDRDERFRLYHLQSNTKKSPR